MSTSKKRTANSPKTSTAKKVPKLSNGSLDSFWSQSASKAVEITPTKVQNKGKSKEEPLELEESDEEPSTPAPISKTQSELDEEFARALARDEGIDIDQLRRNEEDEKLAKRMAVDMDQAGKESLPVHPFFAPIAKGSSSKPKIKHDTPVKIEGHVTATSPSTSANTTPKMAFGSFAAPIEAPQTSYPLDSDIFAFQPSRDIDITGWPKSRQGTTETVQIPYAFLTASFVLISATRSRLKIITILTNVCTHGI